VLDVPATRPARRDTAARSAPRLSRGTQAALVGLVLVGLVLATYWQFVGEYFHGGDTWPHIWTSRVQSPADVWRLLSTPLLTGTIFPDVVARFYRPVSSLSYALDYALFGMDPLAFHLTDLVVHVGVTLELCWLVTLVGARVWAAGAGAATFALHPVMVSVVPSLPRRHDSLAAAGVLGSLGLLAWATTHGGPRWRLAVAGAVALEVFGAWAKEVGYAEVLLVAPVLIAAALAAALPLPSSARRISGLVLLCWGVAFVLVLLRVLVLGGIGGYKDAPSPLGNYDVALNDFVQYLAWPFESIVPRSPRGWLEVFGLLLLASGVPWLFATRRQRLSIAIGWVWLLACLAFQTGTRSLAPYQMYTAIAGLAFLVGGGLAASVDLARHARRPEHLGAGVVGLAGLLVVCGGVLRSSALLTEYQDWHLAGELARQYLGAIRPCLDSVPPGARVEADRYVGGIVDNTSEFILLQPGILGDYSVGPAVYLTMPEHRDLRVTARGAVDLPRFPRAMRADCGQNSDGTWRVTGNYDL
jgi:hypothetical protein